jgi:ABC-2 type transport system permease protein
VTTSLLIARRELVGYFRSMSGWLILAVLLLLDGLAFNAFAMSGEKKSFEVVQSFFYWHSGATMTASVFIAMRLFAEEKQTGTLLLLESAPVREGQVVLGKFLGAWGFLLVFLALSLYMPVLIAVNGKVTAGHLFAGYLGLALLGAACIAIGTFASSVAPDQVLAAILSGAIIVALVIAWLLARTVEGSLGDVIGYLDLFDKHYRSFSRGVVKLSSVVYYVSLTYMFLLGTTAVLGARRWRG